MTGRYRELQSTLYAVAIFAAVAGTPVTATAALGDCAQPVSSGAAPVASDCLFILNVAVGAATCDPAPCVCDPNGNAATSASDALVCLTVAVGGQAKLGCPCSTTTTTTTTTMPFEPAACSDNGKCSDDDCVCIDCREDLFCLDPSNCNDNGFCTTFVEGCHCADCMNHPKCLN